MGPTGGGERRPSMKFGVKRRCVNSTGTALAVLRRARGIIFRLSGHPGWRFHPVRRLHGLGSDRRHHRGESAVAGDRGPGARYRNVATRVVGGPCGTSASIRLSCAFRGIHAAGIQGERERAIQTLPRENL